jgi:multidrug efflux pump subunit AcrA (membrane-fusion protein)
MSLPVTFSSLLDTPPLETTAARSLSRRAVLVPLAIVTTLLIGWASLAPISGAVIAAARIKVELERKTVQHREGGIVREIACATGRRCEPAMCSWWSMTYAAMPSSVCSKIS